MCGRPPSWQWFRLFRPRSTHRLTRLHLVLHNTTTRQTPLRARMDHRFTPTNQTSGSFRDVIWWGPAYNGGTAGVGSPDFINAGKNLISNGGSPARAVVGGQYDALNFTGVKIPNGGASFLTIYDTTPGDGTANRNLFDATGGLQISA